MYREIGKEMEHVRVLFVRTGTGAGKKTSEVVRLQEPVEIAYLAGQIPQYLNKRVETRLADFAVEKGYFRKILQDFRPDISVFWVEKGQEAISVEQAKLARELFPKSLNAVAGEAADIVDSAEIDLKYPGNPVAAFIETIIGVETERSLEEIKSKVAYVDKSFSGARLKPMDRVLLSQSRNGYYFLQHATAREIHSQERVNFNENGILGKDGYELRGVESIASDIESSGAAVYLKDLDIWQSRERLESIISILEERNLKRVYIAAARWGLSSEEELLERFMNLGLKTVVMELRLPEDPETWIAMEEDIAALRKRGIEPVIVVKEELSKEDADALVFWLKKLNEGLVVLEGDAFKNNKEIYKELCLSMKIYWRWFSELGLMEASRRQKEYKKSLLL